MPQQEFKGILCQSKILKRLYIVTGCTAALVLFLKVINIRYTDMRMDYDTFCEQIKPEIIDHTFKK